MNTSSSIQKSAAPAPAPKCVAVAAAAMKAGKAKAKVPISQHEQLRDEAYVSADALMVQQVLSWCSRMEHGKLVPGERYLADTVQVRLQSDLSFHAFRSEGQITNDAFAVKVSGKTFQFKKSQLLNNPKVQAKIATRLQELCPDAGFIGVGARKPTQQCKNWQYWIKVAVQ